MKTLILTIGHEMLPFAWRLAKEGNEVTIVQQNHKNFYRCWEGKFHKHHFDKQEIKDGAQYKFYAQAVEEHGAVILNKSYKWHRGIQHLKNTYSTLPYTFKGCPATLLGAWFDGDQFQAKHLLFTDVGLYDGNVGPEVCGGLTMLSPSKWPSEFDQFLHKCRPRLLENNFRGLVQVLYEYDVASKRSEYRGFRAGWHHFHAHAFLADQSLTSILQGAVPVLRKRFTCVVPVSVWPYPTMKIDRDVNEHVAIREQVLREISPEFLSRIYWHDIQTNEAKSQIITADTDGLIGIAHGSGNSLHLARTMATAAADQIRLRGRVMRHDVGQHVDNILADLEMNGVEL